MSKYNKISFRDPSGFVFEKNNKIFRGINKSEKIFFDGIFSSKWFNKFLLDKKIQSFKITQEITDSELYFLEHKKFQFPILPNQFCAEQLYLGGLLTLEIAIEAIQNDVILKDASAWNIFFNDSNPLFCDITSFEEWDKSKNWYAYGQFARHFIIPLIVFKYSNINVSRLFQVYQDGIKPEEAFKIIGLKSLLSLASLETIFLPNLFHRKKIDLNKINNKNNKGNEINKKIIISTLKRLRKYISSLKPSNFNQKDKWSDYISNREHYSAKDISEKRNFVENAIDKKGLLVLDLSCNDGEFSILAEKKGSYVIAADNDEMSLVNLQKKIQSQNISVCNLDILNPTPQIGFNNKENKSFIDRAKDYFDNVLFLGIVHHMTVTNKVPLDLIVEFLFNLTKNRVVFELIDKNDIKFIELSKQIKNVNFNLDRENFEKIIKDKFKILKFKELHDNKRKLYLLEKIRN